MCVWPKPKQVSQGDTKAATQISQQIESKIQGKIVAEPYRVISALFIQYDSARQAALRPIQAASIQRLDALLKTSSGKDMGAVLRIAQAREQIESGTLGSTLQKEKAETKPRFPMMFGYYVKPEREVICGHVTINADGTFAMGTEAGSLIGAAMGTWTATDKPNVLAAVLVKTGEKGTITLNGEEGEYQREGVGLRYLKAE